MINPHFNYSKDTDLEGQYSPDYPWFDRIYPHFYHIPSFSTILDVGCNSGGLSTLLQKRHCTFYGVDLAHHLLLKAIPKGYHVVQSYGECLPFQDNVFDVVVLSEILEHADNPVLVSKEAVRVLKPGGKIVGDVPHWIGKWGYRSIWRHKWHKRVFHKWSLKPLFPFPVHIQSVPKFNQSIFWLPQWYCFHGIKSV